MPLNWGKTTVILHKNLFKSNGFKIYHQNICGISNKTSEIYAHLHPDYPQILCFKEHHFKYSQIENLTIINCSLGTSYCRESFIMGGVCTYVQNPQNYEAVNIRELCIDKALEARAVKCKFVSSIFCIWPFVGLCLVISPYLLPN
jgi:hypothetical protein